MPLRFSAIYKLTGSSNYLDTPQIALGVRKLRRSPGPGLDETYVYEFVVASVDNWRHEIFGGVLSENGQVVTLLDAVRVGNDGKPVSWRFEPLSLAVWHGMGEAVVGFDELKIQITSDEDLEAFYYSEALPDFWTEAGDEPGQ